MPPKTRGSARHVALKALPPAFTRDPVRRERLKREARAAAALSHPAIATIFALEEIDGDLYIVSELVRGRTLRDELRDGPLPPRLLHETLVDIASALAAAHARGIVHRDLKPENVIRRADGQIKILDFGLARIGRTSSSTTFTRLTEAGIAMGTPGYMAPEQFQGSDVDARADQFAFGILAWELATGEHPFGSDAGSLVARMSDMMDGRTPPGLSRPLAPPGLHRIACRCMRGRPASAIPPPTRCSRICARSPPISAASAATTPMPTGLWWWQFHQKAVAIVNGVTPVLAWFVRKWAVRPYGRVGILRSPDPRDRLRDAAAAPAVHIAGPPGHAGAAARAVLPLDCDRRRTPRRGAPRIGGTPGVSPGRSRGCPGESGDRHVRVSRNHRARHHRRRRDLTTREPK